MESIQDLYSSQTGRADYDFVFCRRSELSRDYHIRDENIQTGSFEES